MTTQIVLAAGQGTRLRPLTDSVPKCMVQLHGKPLIEWQVHAAKKAGIERVVVVGGYKADVLEYLPVHLVINEKYATTNMLQSLMCASEFLHSGALVSYGDIVFSPELLGGLSKFEDDVVTCVDLDWLSYWSDRFTDVLSDAESLNFDDNAQITSIGNPPKSIENIQGQYIGLTRFSAAGAQRFLGLLESAERMEEYGVSDLLQSGRSFQQAYFTDALQALSNCGAVVRAYCHHGGWLEIDSPEDLILAQSLSAPLGSELEIRR